MRSSVVDRPPVVWPDATWGSYVAMTSRRDAPDLALRAEAEARLRALSEQVGVVRRRRRLVDPSAAERRRVEARLKALQAAVGVAAGRGER